MDSDAGQVDKTVQALGATLTERIDQVDGSAVQAVQGLQEEQAEALGALRDAVERQAGELAALREQLQADRDRRPWWQRWFGGDDRG